MFKKINELTKINKIFQDSSNSYWDDPYISKNLLKAHLEKNSDNASRNQNFTDKSISFIDSLLKEHKLNKIIDFGCGPGIYTERLNMLGYDVTGIDFSKRSIDYAKESAQSKGLSINYQYKDYLNIELEAEYDFASLIYCDYGSLDPVSRKKLLSNIYKSLKPGGYFLIDVFTADKFLDIKEEKTWDHLNHSFWSNEEHISLSNTETFQNFVALDQSIIITEHDIKSINRWYQYFTKDMIEDELLSSNFKIISFFKDVKGEKYENDSRTVAFLLQKES